jgi:hypothetical protein
MSYPLSSTVSAGDPTASAHYNNLRLDALYFGQANTDAVNLGTLMERYESRLTLERLNTAQVRVPATTAEPVSLMVYGYPVQATANVDLAAGSAPAGGANTYYVFANRSGSSTTFTLSISTSSTEAANQRRIGRFYWDGSVIVKDSVRTELSIQLTSLLYYKEPHLCEGRLTLSTGDATPNVDINSSALVYFTPFIGDRVSLYVPNYGWRVYPFSEITLDISGYAINKNIDVFLYDNAGVLTLAGTEWSNDTLRATALVRQDGQWVKQNALNYLYLGTVRTYAAGASCDTYDQRFCWNCFNRIPRSLIKQESTSSWTYATASTLRYWNNDSNNKLEFLVGLTGEIIFVVCFATGAHSSAAHMFMVGLGFDNATISNDAKIYSHGYGTTHQHVQAIYNGYPSLGYHYLAMQEYTTGSTLTMYSTWSPHFVGLSGAVGWIRA